MYSTAQRTIWLSAHRDIHSAWSDCYLKEDLYRTLIWIGEDGKGLYWSYISNQIWYAQAHVGETPRWNFSLGKQYKSDIYGNLPMEIGCLKVESARVQSLAR